MRKQKPEPSLGFKNVGAEGISFVIPVSQSLYVDRLANCLAAIEAQNHGPRSYFEYVFVYIYRKGEEEPWDKLRPLLDLVRRYDATLVSYGHELPDYPLALARNVGARRSSRRYLAICDADLVLDPQKKEIKQIIFSVEDVRDHFVVPHRPFSFAAYGLVYDISVKGVRELPLYDYED